MAATLTALVAQHLGEDVFERIVAHLTTDGLVAVVADIESGAIEMAALFGGISVNTAQTGHIVHGTQHTGHNELVKGNALYVETVVEGFADVVKQNGSTRHQIGYGTI